MSFGKIAGISGTLLVILTLVITLLKQIIAFIGFITGAFKLLIVLAFIIVIAGVGFLIVRSWNDSKRKNA